MNKPTLKQINDTDVMIRQISPMKLVPTVSMEDFVSVLRCAAWYRDQLAVANGLITKLRGGDE